MWWLLACDGTEPEDSDGTIIPTTEDTGAEDHDGDGFSPPYDCEDYNPNIHPDAEDLPCDLNDNDCDGEVLRGPFVADRLRSFDSLSKALDAATQLVEVCPGTHATNVRFEPTTSDLVTIRGVGAGAILDGGGVDRIIAAYGANLAVEGITFQNGLREVEGVEGAGGAIYLEGSLAIRDAAFAGNIAAFGGAVAVVVPDGGLVSVERTEFTGNEAEDPSWYQDSDGGALWVSCAGNGASATLTLSETSFVQNRCERHGGGVFTTYDCERMDVDASDVVFEDNGGGSIHLAAKGSVVASMWNVSVSDDPDPSAIRAPTLQLTAGNLSFTGTQCCGNAPMNDVDAGALQLAGDMVVAISDLTISGVISEETSSGALAIVGGAATVTLERATFTDNDLAGDFVAAAAVNLYATREGPLSLSITDSVFTGNQVSSPLSLFAPSGTATMMLTRTAIGENVGETAGAVAIVAKDGDSRLEDVTVTGNEGKDAGALYLYGEAPTVTVVGGKIASNTASRGAALSGSGGGRIVIEGVDLGAESEDNVPADADGCPDGWGAGAWFTWFADGHCE